MTPRRAHLHRSRLIAVASLVMAFATLALFALRAQEPQNNPPKLERNPSAALATPTPPPASSTSVTFSGSTRFNDNQLKAAIADQITELDEQGVNPATADDAAFFLGIFFRKNGYSDVTVDSKILGSHAIALFIKEGPITLLGTIHFHGVSGLPVATLQDYIAGTTRERFPNPKGALPFVQSDIDTGVERIRGLYASEGYLDAVIDPPVVTLNRAHTSAAVDLTIHEGIQYHFGEINFAGDLVFKKINFANTGASSSSPDSELLTALKPFTTKPYTSAQVTNMQRAVVYYYKTHGYYDPKVDVLSDPKTAKNGYVPTTFTVTTGPIYRFGGVSQEGLDRLNPRFLPSRFASLRGKFYNPQLLDAKFREMMQTGLFRQLRVEPRPLPDDTVELHMAVEEEKSKELGFSLGYGTFEGPIIGLVAGDRDLFGTGRSLTSNLELSANFLRGDILYQDPWLLDSDYKLNLRLYGQSEVWYRYSVLETGFRPEISRQLTKYLQASAFMELKEVKATDEGIDLPDFGPSSYFVSTVGSSLTIDTRTPDKINPRQGLIGGLIGEVASSSLGSSVQFIRATARFSYYLPITQSTMLAFGARGGWLKSLDGSPIDIPIDERFFNGGSRSVRSFSERRLGPTDWHGYPIGGDTFTTFNVEYQFPVYGALIGALFADAGSVGQSPDQLGLMRYGIGPGLRYASPVGPIRIDLGYNPDRRPGERHFVIHISFGVAF
jgi:outer membrane protein insertion porin family